MTRSRRIRLSTIKVIIEPVQAPIEEYEKAWMEALEIVQRLSRRLDASGGKPD